MTNSYGLRMFLAAAVLLCLALSGDVLATQFAGGQSIYIIDTVEINDDLFAAGRNVNISGRIRGDLFISGMSATCDGRVDGSVMVFAYDFNMSGNCRNSVRVLARRVDVDGHIERNLMAFGVTIVLGKKGWVEQDVHVGGSELLVQGRIGGMLDAEADQIYISGKIDGDVKIKSNNVVIQPTAIIGGNLQTYGKEKPKIEPGAQILGETTHSAPKKKEGGGYNFGDFLVDIWSFLALALTGGIFLVFFRDFTREVTDYIQANWLMSLGLGLVFFICLPIAAGILVITLVGIPLGLVVLAGWTLLFYLSKVFAGILIGEWTLKTLRRGKTPGLFWSMILGLIVVILILNIPYGYVWIPIKLLILFLGFGGFFLVAAQRHNRKREAGRKASADITV